MENVKYWIFKIPDWENPTEIQETMKFEFIQKLKFSGLMGDRGVILAENRNDYFFVASLNIVEISSEVINIEDVEKTKYTIEYKLDEVFEENKPLGYYLYSIKRVRNWDRPNSHFKRKYTEINQLEYEAITKDKVFLERTILGGVLNELPVEHRLSFLNLLMSEMPNVFFEIKDYTKVFNLLKQYLEFAIINPSKMLYESFSILKEILPDQNFDDVSFGEVNPDYQVSSQSKIKDQVVMIDSNLSVFVELLEMGSTSKTQEEKLFISFNDLFKGMNLSHLIKKI